MRGDLQNVVGELAANQVAWGGRTLIDGATVADALTGLYDHTGGTSVGVQGDHGVDGSVHGSMLRVPDVNWSLLLKIRSTSLGSCW